MSRRQSNTVSLFPFLAVLVCAMGALILLLLVTTRRIRSNQLAAQAEVVSPAAPEPVVTPAVPEPTAWQPEAVTFPVAHVADTPPPAVADPTTDSNWHQRDLAALRRRAAELRLSRTASAERFKTLQETVANIERQHADALSALENVTDEQAAAAQEQQTAELVRQEAQSQLASLKRDLEQARKTRKKAVSRFRVVPFDGVSGTIRRPILIECTERGFRFLPEGIELTEVQLAGFVSGFNPLLSGTAALHAYWTQRDRAEGHNTEPYVLLIVRPGGSVSFYAARRMLARLDTSVGYELLTDDQELDLPKVEPAAVELLRLAIQKTLARQGDLMELAPLARAVMSGRGPTPRVGRSTSIDRTPAERAPAARFAAEAARRAESRRSATHSRGSDRHGLWPAPDSSPQLSRPGRMARAVPNGQGQGRVVRNGRITSGSGRGESEHSTVERGAAGDTSGSGQVSEPGGRSRSPHSSEPSGRPEARPGAPNNPYPPGSDSGDTSDGGQGHGNERGTEEAGPTEPGRLNGPVAQSDDAAKEFDQILAGGSDASGDRSTGTHNGGAERRDAGNRARSERGPALSVKPATAPSGAIDDVVSSADQVRIGRSGAGSLPRIVPRSEDDAGQTSSSHPSASHQNGAPHSAGSQPSGMPGSPGGSAGGPQGPSGPVSSSPAGQQGLSGSAGPDGLRFSPGLIGFRRRITLHVDPDAVTVGADEPVAVDQSQLAGPWTVAVLQKIGRQIESWGPAPQGMRWVPEVRLVVSPGAQRTQTRLRSELSRRGVVTSEELTLTPRGGTGNRAAQGNRGQGGSR